APGSGTTFRVFLPRETAPTPGTVVDAPTSESDNGRETILLAEDDDSVRQLAMTLLERAGYHVIATPDAESAMAAAAAHTGPIDLLLTDVIMPGANGRELANQFAVTHPDARILFMSGYADDVLSAQGVLDPNVAFLEKPFLPADLARKVRQVLDEPPAAAS
ncbi:MAG: hypothetical protein QOJ75_1470, partial [Chloroflexota bacterium]|nr:hypothetical protein [Chloroflexota bacterium]